MRYETREFDSLDAMALSLGSKPRWYQLSAGKFGGTFRRALVAGVRFTVCDWNLSVLANTQTVNGYCTLFTQLGNCVFYNYGKPLKRDILISSGRRHHVVRIPKGCRTLTVEIPMTFFETNTLFTRLQQPIPKNGAMCASVERLEFWQSLRHCVTKLFSEKSEIDLNDQLVRPMNAAVEHEPRLDELCESLVERRANVRKAQDLIEERFPNPVTMRELHERLEIPERTIRFQFDEVYGMPPSKFSRLHRLTEAWRALRAANPAGTTVQEVARQCGFTHLSHFTDAYRDHFKRLPSHTLRESPDEQYG